MRFSFYFLAILAILAIYSFIGNDNKIEEPEKKITPNVYLSNVQAQESINEKLTINKKEYSQYCEPVDFEIYDPIFFQQKKEDLLELLSKINSQNLRRRVIDSILIDSGVGLYLGHQHLRGNDIENLANISSQNLIFMDFKNTKRIKDLVDNKNIKQLLELYIDPSIPKDRKVIINQKAYTAFQLAFLIFRNEDNPDNQLEDYVDILIANGLSVKLSDLVAYINKSVSIDVIQKLSNGFEGDAGQVFIHEGEVHTLVSLSVKKSNTQSTKYWLNEGVSPSTLKFRHNAMDYIINYTTPNHLEEMLILLVDYDVSPNSSNTFDFLQHNLTEDFKKKHEKLMNFIDYRKLTKEEYYSKQRSITNIFKLAFKDVNLSNNCISSYQDKKLLVKKIITYKGGGHQTLLTKVSDIDHTKILIPKRQNKKNNNVENGLSFTPPKKDSKQAQLIKSGKWKSVLKSQLEKVNLTYEEELEASFALALIGGASSEELIEFINKGAPINPGLVNLIINKCDIDVIKALYRNGYNFNYIYPDGSNAIVAAVSKKKLAILDFLISIGLNVNPKGEFGTPLSIALLGIQFSGDLSFKIVNSLIEAGSQVDLSHKNYVNSLVTSNFEYYLRLVNEQPSLRI
jgi:hypothetical protein